VLEKQQLFVQYPSGEPPSGKSGWPAVIFSHALNLGYEWYEPQMQRLASHGIVAVFTFIRSQAEDDAVKPAVDDTTGDNMERALNIMRRGLIPNIKFDISNVALAGHNMGAVSAIRVAAKYPKGTAKLCCDAPLSMQHRATSLPVHRQLEGNRSGK
jgi:pimeloyl-ACP methyl ester carboxylesterase